MLLPKLKLLRIGSSYKKQDKDVLRLALLEKNSCIKGLVDQGHTFDVIIIDEVFHYAVLKVSPEIRNAILEKRTIFLDMESLEVQDQFHVIQCFSCQQLGHKRGDDVCKHKDSENVTCLYCSENHFSKVCPHKKDSSKWCCSNCLHSDNAQIRESAKGHPSTSNTCPFIVQHVKSLINRTQGLDVKNYFK